MFQKGQTHLKNLNHFERLCIKLFRSCSKVLYRVTHIWKISLKSQKKQLRQDSVSVGVETSHLLKHDSVISILLGI